MLYGRANPMLKISNDGRTRKSRGTVLTLEGQVVGPWVEELRRVCDEILETIRLKPDSTTDSASATDSPIRLTLDLSEVSFIDADGIALVRALASRGALVTHASLFVAQQLKEVGHAHS